MARFVPNRGYDLPEDAVCERSYHFRYGDVALGSFR